MKKVILYMIVLILLTSFAYGFNGTVGNGLTMVSVSSAGTSGHGYGFEIQPKLDIDVYSTTRNPSAIHGNHITIYRKSDKANISMATYTGTIAVFPEVIHLNKSEQYYIITDYAGAVNWNRYYKSPVTYKIQNFSIDWNSGIDHNELTNNFLSVTDKGYSVETINLSFNNNFSIIALRNGTNTTIYDFTVNISNSTWSDVYSSNITTGKIITNISRFSPSLFNFTVTSSNYTNGTFLNRNVSYGLTAELNPLNELQLYIREESTNNLITNNVSINFYSDDYSKEVSTITGQYNTSSIPNSQYSIKFSSANYTTRYYNITFSNSGKQILTAYLTNSSSYVIFTIKDVTTGKLLDNAGLSMYRFINGSWRTVESHFTDITGKAKFNYIEDIEYRFLATKPTYNNKQFQLNPIQFSEYDITLKKSSLDIDLPAYYGVSVAYEPRIFYANQVNNFSFYMQSPNGLLNSYGFSLVYPTGSIIRTGNNSIGELWDINFTIGNPPLYPTVNLTYFYETQQTGLKTYSYNYEIINEEVIGNYTMMANTNKTYGMGLFERVLISVLIGIFVTGIASLVAGGIAGAGLGLLVFGYLTYIGFIPIWGILISMLVGFIVLAWRSD